MSRELKPAAANALSEFKDEYVQAFSASRHSQGDEGLSLGVDSTTARAYLLSDSDRHLPAGLVPRSIFAHPLMNHLAEKCGGVFVPLVGHLNGSSNDELAAILRLAGQIVRESDPLKRARLFKQIETKAARAAKEEEK